MGLLFARFMGDSRGEWPDIDLDLPVPVLPLYQMNIGERLVADYAGTGLSLYKHPMCYRRSELSRRESDQL
jgi:hypothetical protein